MAKAIRYYFEINVWVVHSAQGWTEQDAENALDALDDEIKTAIEENGGTRAHWVSLNFGGRSNAEGVRDEKGRVYLHEAIPIFCVVNPSETRQQVREAIAILLSGACVSARSVYAYQVKDFSTRSPVVYVASAGSDRTGQ